MNEASTTQQRADLRRLFAVRMPKKLRQLLELWRRYEEAGWTAQTLVDFLEHCERVKLSAANFEFFDVESLVHEIATLYTLVKSGREAPDLLQISELQSELATLADEREIKDRRAYQGALAVSDEQSVCVALGDLLLADDLARQLGFFGYRAQIFSDIDALSQALSEQTPAALVVDLSLPGAQPALAELREQRSNPIPCLMLGDNDDLATRLQAVRAGGDAFFAQPLVLSDLIHKLDALTAPVSPVPYRILVVEDSRAQAKHADIVLKSVGLSSHVVTEPLLLMEALLAFHPELILMDMQMPGVTGLELARVLRQHASYAAIPIVFLSAEDDAQKRLTALTIAGDDFLTKPLRADQLLEAVTNRAQRARAAAAQQATDALTGLLNRQHFLNALETEVSRANRTNAPLALAVLDIDHLAAINRVHGQPLGDNVLQTLAKLLSQRLRKTDFLGRIADDRIGVLLPNCNAANAIALLTQLCRQFASLTYPAAKSPLHARFSGGLALLSEYAVGPLMAAAETALTDAKRQGGNRIVLSDIGLSPSS